MALRKAASSLRERAKRIEEESRVSGRASAQFEYRGLRTGASARKSEAYNAAHARRSSDIPIAALLLAIFAIGLIVGFSSWMRSVRDAQLAAQQELEANEQSTPVSATTTIELAMVGDVVAHQSVIYTGVREDGSYNFNHLFQNVRNEIEGADLAIVSQATPLAGSDFGLWGDASFNGPQELGDSEAYVGFDVVLKASEHVLDAGYDGLSAEMSFWRVSHPMVKVIGCVDPYSDEYGSVDDICIYEKNGFSIAILNYVYASGVSDERGAISTYEESRVREQIRRAREYADMVVVCPHWGTADTSYPNSEQPIWSQVFLEEGVDVVIGTHPRVLQDVEVLEGADGHRMLCYWSLGTFVSGYTGSYNMLGGIAKVSFEKTAAGDCSITSYSLIPTVVHAANGTNETVYPLYAYTPQLVETSAYPWLTVNWAKDYCTVVFGDDFNRETSRIVEEF